MIKFVSNNVYCRNAKKGNDQTKKKDKKLCTLPVSTTYLIFGIVSEVSATLVATIQSRHPSGGGSNTCKYNITNNLLVWWWLKHL